MASKGECYEQCGLPLTKTRRDGLSGHYQAKPQPCPRGERERADFSRERGGHKLREKRKPSFLFLLDVIFPFMYLVDFLFHVGLG